jgi:hypothetical protein
LIVRRVAGVVGACLIAGLSGWYIPAHGAGQSAGLRERDTYRDMQEVVAKLPEHDRARVYLMPPGVLIVGRAPCWLLSVKWDSYNCPVTGDVVLGTRAASQVRWTGEAGIMFMIGHELGHGQQPASSLLTLSSFPRENNADCLGGAYAAERLGHGDDVRQKTGAVAFSMGGDDPSRIDFHGTPGQRREAALLGFDGGVIACQQHSFL